MWPVWLRELILSFIYLASEFHIGQFQIEHLHDCQKCYWTVLPRAVLQICITVLSVEEIKAEILCLLSYILILILFEILWTEYIELLKLTSKNFDTFIPHKIKTMNTSWTSEPYFIFATYNSGFMDNWPTNNCPCPRAFPSQHHY